MVAFFTQGSSEHHATTIEIWPHHKCNSEHHIFVQFHKSLATGWSRNEGNARRTGDTINLPTSANSFHSPPFLRGDRRVAAMCRGSRSTSNREKCRSQMDWPASPQVAAMTTLGQRQSLSDFAEPETRVDVGRHRGLHTGRGQPSQPAPDPAVETGGDLRSPRAQLAPCLKEQPGLLPGISQWQLPGFCEPRVAANKGHSSPGCSHPSAAAPRFDTTQHPPGIETIAGRDWGDRFRQQQTHRAVRFD